MSKLDYTHITMNELMKSFKGRYAETENKF